VLRQSRFSLNDRVNRSILNVYLQITPLLCIFQTEKRAPLRGVVAGSCARCYDWRASHLPQHFARFKQRFVGQFWQE